MHRKASLPSIAISIVITLMILGTWFFRYLEDWRWVDAFYFTAMTISTVGYRDLVPSHDLSKIVAALFGIVGIPIALFAFSVITQNYFETRLKSLERRMRTLLDREEEIEELLEEDKPRRKGFFSRLLNS